ncbi:flagellar protein FlbB [uncultured Brachyspira sp.]|uniref:periplasmic-type flagellar collar protein FlbB n=1 Tax=uncultured Brachyspira sp. TaxID=221953 RepID=UPI0026014C12|nr:flagellar protein FlbB [uncultured Brachyspira sp.]
MKFKIAILTVVNLIAFIALLYMFDIFGVVNYYTLMRTKIAPNVPSFLTRFTQKPRVEDMALLARDDLNKMRESFNLREKDIQAQEALIASKAIELNSQSELIEQDRQNLLNAWSNYQATMDESAQYQLVLTDLANKINSMPPQNSVALLNQLAANGSDDLIIDVLVEMDSIAAAEGRNSTTSYLLSLMDTTVAARILEKYEARTNPNNNTVPSSPNDFPSYTPDNNEMLNDGIMDMGA